jgi:hypothetical protein
MPSAHCSGIRLTTHRLVPDRAGDPIERDRRSDASLRKTLLQLSGSSKVGGGEAGIGVYFFEEQHPQ